MSQSYVVGVHSTRESGKDTLYKRLRDLNPRCRRFAFADSLKSDLAPLLLSQFHFDIFNCTPAQKDLARPLLISYGMAWRTIDPLHWVKVVIDQIDLLRETDRTAIPVITDVRFENEAQLLSDRYSREFHLVDLVRDGAPSPTDEEEKHFRQVRAMAQYHIRWGHNTEEKQREYARWLLGRLGVGGGNVAV